MINKNNEFTFPLNETYVAFGDGSVTKSGVFYGLVLIPSKFLDLLSLEINKLKIEYGGKENSSLHCRELFNEFAIKKSDWSHLSKDDVVRLCGDVLKKVNSFEPKYLLGHIPATKYPKRFRLKGKNGHRDLTHPIDEKWLLLWAYFRIVAILDPEEIVTPEDPKEKPSPRNKPFWRMEVGRDDPGIRVSKIILDREKTIINWFSKKFQWATVAKEIVINGPRGASYLPIEPAENLKHELIDVADIFSYSIARDLYSVNQLDYKDFKADVLMHVIVGAGEEIVLGG